MCGAWQRWRLGGGRRSVRRARRGGGGSWRLPSTLLAPLFSRPEIVLRFAAREAINEFDGGERCVPPEEGRRGGERERRGGGGGGQAAGGLTCMAPATSSACAFSRAAPLSIHAL